MRARVQPRNTSSQYLHAQLPRLKIRAVEVGDLQLATCRGFELRRESGNLTIIEVDSWNCKMGSGLGGLLFNADCLAPGVKCHDAVTLRITHGIAKDRCAFLEFRCISQDIGH